MEGIGKELKEPEIGKSRRGRKECVRALAGNEGKWRGLGGLVKKKKDVKENEGKLKGRGRKWEEIERKGNQQHL